VAGAGAVAGLLPPALSRTPASAARTAADGRLAQPGLIASDFLRPSTQAKPMVRTWFPDAGSGESADGLALVARQFTGQAAAGFGGAEIAFLSDNTSYTNADAQTIGFGSANWRTIVKQILRTANSMPGGFKIDLTLSSHWPVAVDIIDPNDDPQQQQLVSAYAKITAAGLASPMDLPMPAQRTTDASSVPFLFVDTFVAATVAKVGGFSGSTPVLALASLTDVSGRTSKYGGSPAGIPDQAYATARPPSCRPAASAS